MNYIPFIGKIAPVFGVFGVFGGGSYLLKDYKSPKYNGKESLAGKTVVITGASKGVGKEAATCMAMRGAKVILACKEQEKCIAVRRSIVDKTLNSEVYCSILDLGSQKSIREFIKRLDEKKVEVNILINNAAIKSMPIKSTRDGFEANFGVNYLGPFYLTYLLMDNLLRNKPAKIINVSCIDQMKAPLKLDNLNLKLEYDPYKAYAQSKLANILFTKELASRFKGTNVWCYSVDPGICHTSLDRELRYRKNYLAYIFVRPFLWFLHRTAKMGARVINYVALCPDLENDEHSGLHFKNNAQAPVNPIAEDPIVRKKLWKISEKWSVERLNPS